jgi:hypothetical protein
LREPKQPHGGIALNQHFGRESAIIHKRADALAAKVSCRHGSPYRVGRSAHRLNIKNPLAPAAKRETEEEWR